MARPIIDLPAPDSPISPRMRPGARSRSSALMIGSSSPSRRALTVRD